MIIDVAKMATAVADRGALSIPDPVAAAPPGAEKMEMVLNWGLWVVIALAVLGLFVVAGSMAINHRRGEGGQHASGLAFVLIGLIVAGSAAGLVQAFV